MSTVSIEFPFNSGAVKEFDHIQPSQDLAVNKNGGSALSDMDYTEAYGGVSTNNQDSVDDRASFSNSSESENEDEGQIIDRVLESLGDLDRIRDHMIDEIDNDETDGGARVSSGGLSEIQKAISTFAPTPSPPRKDEAYNGEADVEPVARIIISLGERDRNSSQNDHRSFQNSDQQCSKNLEEDDQQSEIFITQHQNSEQRQPEIFNQKLDEQDRSVLQERSIVQDHSVQHEHSILQDHSVQQHEHSVQQNHSILQDQLSEQNYQDSIQQDDVASIDRNNNNRHPDSVQDPDSTKIKDQSDSTVKNRPVDDSTICQVPDPAPSSERSKNILPLSSDLFPHVQTNNKRLKIQTHRLTNDELSNRDDAPSIGVVRNDNTTSTPSTVKGSKRSAVTKKNIKRKLDVNDEEQLVCIKCSRSYKRKKYYYDHIEICNYPNANTPRNGKRAASDVATSSGTKEKLPKLVLQVDDMPADDASANSVRGKRDSAVLLRGELPGRTANGQGSRGKPVGVKPPRKSKLESNKKKSPTSSNPVSVATRLDECFVRELDTEAVAYCDLEINLSAKKKKFKIPEYMAMPIDKNISSAASNVDITSAEKRSAAKALKDKIKRINEEISAEMAKLNSMSKSRDSSAELIKNTRIKIKFLKAYKQIKHAEFFHSTGKLSVFAKRISNSFKLKKDGSEVTPVNFDRGTVKKFILSMGECEITRECLNEITTALTNYMSLVPMTILVAQVGTRKSIKLTEASIKSLMILQNQTNVNKTCYAMLEHSDVRPPSSASVISIIFRNLLHLMNISTVDEAFEVMSKGFDGDPRVIWLRLLVSFKPTKGFAETLRSLYVIYLIAAYYALKRCNERNRGFRNAMAYIVENCSWFPFKDCAVHTITSLTASLDDLAKLYRIADSLDDGGKPKTLEDPSMKDAPYSNTSPVDVLSFISKKRRNRSFDNNNEGGDENIDEDKPSKRKRSKPQNPMVVETPSSEYKSRSIISENDDDCSSTEPGGFKWQPTGGEAYTDS